MEYLMRTKSRWGKKKLPSNCKTIYLQYFVTLFHVCVGYYLDTPLAEWNSLQPVSPSWGVHDMVEAAGLCTMGPGCLLPTRLNGSVSWGGKTGLNRIYLPSFVLSPNLMPLSQLLQDEASFFYPTSLAWLLRSRFVVLSVFLYIQRALGLVYVVQFHFH